MFLDFHLIVSPVRGENADSLIVAVAEAPVSRRAFCFDRLDLADLREQVGTYPGMDLEEDHRGQFHLQCSPNKTDSSARDARRACRTPQVGWHLRERLFSILFPAESYAYRLLGRSCLRANSLRARGEDSYLRVKLELPSELSNLPWEMISCPRTGAWSREILRAKICYVRYLGDLPDPTRSKARSKKPVALIVYSDPHDHRSPEMTESFRSELSHLERIFSEPEIKAEIDLKWVGKPESSATPQQRQPRGTLRELRELVYQLDDERRPIAGIHYIGHGGVDEDGGFLLGEGDLEGTSQRIHELELRQALDKVVDLRWAIFNACSTAFEPIGCPLAGLATSVAELKNVPIVMAYRRRVETQDAELLAPEFYKSVMKQSTPIDEAVRDLQLRHDNPGGLVVLTHSVEGEMPADLGLGGDGEEEPPSEKQRRRSHRRQPEPPDEGREDEERPPAPGELGEMVLVPAGPFTKGLSPEQIDALIAQFRDQGLGLDLESTRELLRQKEVEQIELDAFEIDVTPVTNAQFRAFTDATRYLTEAERSRAPQSWRSYDQPGRERHPVALVSYYDARQFCDWAGKRLPTADEWKKAYRGTEGRIYPWGDVFDPGLCNTKEGEHGWGTTPVDRFAEGASPYGCLDLMGNVEEWTSTAGEGGSMMVLGSSWSRIGQIYGLPELHRLASPHFYSNEHGFRCARDGGE